MGTVTEPTYQLLREIGPIQCHRILQVKAVSSASQIHIILPPSIFTSWIWFNEWNLQTNHFSKINKQIIKTKLYTLKKRSNREPGPGPFASALLSLSCSGAGSNPTHSSPEHPMGRSRGCWRGALIGFPSGVRWAGANSFVLCLH